MIRNERGGIISKIMFLPVALALMAGFFFLGYFVGKYPSKSKAIVQSLPPMPEAVSKNIPKPEDFTFYKTLTDTSNNTISIDLKPKSAPEEKRVEKKNAEKPSSPAKETQAPHREKTAEKKHEKKNERKNVKKKSIESPARTTAQNKAAAPAVKGTVQRYTLQIASYQEKSDAEADVKKMKQWGYAAFVRASELPGKGTWYRVRLGSFASKASAERLQKELRAKEGISPFITVE